MIAADVGTTYQLGRFTIRVGLRPDNPAFPRFLVFLGDDLVGKQFSRPCVTDCEWLLRSQRSESQYAEPSKAPFAFTVYRRGRPTNAERARRATLEVEDLAA